MHEELRSEVVALKSEIEELSALEDITPEQDERLDAAISDYETKKATLDKADARDAKVADIRSHSVARPGHDAGPTFIDRTKTAYDEDVRSMSGNELRDAALRTLDDRDNVNHLSDAAKAEYERKIRGAVANGASDYRKWAVLTTRPEYRSAFVKYMLEGNEAMLSPEESRAVQDVKAFSRSSSIDYENRAASTTTTAGGYAVPETLDVNVILTNDGVVEPVRAISRVETGTNNQWKGVNSAGVTASWDQEGTEVSDDAPTLAQPTVTAAKGNAFIPFSYEIGDDWATLASEAVMLFRDAKMRLEGTAFATGSGSNQPKGIVTALDATTYAEVLPTTDGSFGIEDLYKVYRALPPRFRANASWIMEISALNRIRQFSTSSPGTFTVDLTQGYKFAILGRPAYENSNMADLTTLTTGASNLLVVGDFRYYLIYDRVGASVEFIPHLFSTGNGRPTGQRGWQFWWRTGADMVTNSANPGFRLLQNQ